MSVNNGFHALFLGLSMLTAVRAGFAQTVSRISPAQAISQQYESRAHLEAEAKAAEAQGRSSEAWLLRARLQQGDFREGDRIIVSLENSARVDTMQVRAGRVIQFVGMADLPLAGVLRSEITEAVHGHLAKYLKNPSVRVTPLLSVLVSGNVTLPGYYYVTPDLVLRDVIMRAGGPRDANLEKTVVRRDGQLLWNADATRAALVDGLSLDQLHLRAGDELVVPPRRHIQAATILSLVSASTALIVLVLSHR